MGGGGGRSGSGFFRYLRMRIILIRWRFRIVLKCRLMVAERLGRWYKGGAGSVIDLVTNHKGKNENETDKNCRIEPAHIRIR